VSMPFNCVLISVWITNSTIYIFLFCFSDIFVLIINPSLSSRRELL
jgi:hypothetical protein